MAGKSQFLTNLILEKKQHFPGTIDQIIVIHKVEDDNILTLKKKFPKTAVFLDDIPETLVEDLAPKRSICVIDDMEADIMKDKRKINILNYCSSVAVHHRGLRIFCCLQTMNIFYKKNVMNQMLMQATHLCLFRSVSTFSSLKTWLNSYSVKLKSDNQSLYDLYTETIQPFKYSYLLLDISPCLNTPKCYSQILLCDERPMLLFSTE